MCHANRGANRPTRHAVSYLVQYRHEFCRCRDRSFCLYKKLEKANIVIGRTKEYQVVIQPEGENPH